MRGFQMIDLDEYETDILQSVENDEWQSRGSIDNRITILRKKSKEKSYLYYKSRIRQIYLKMSLNH